VDLNKKYGVHVCGEGGEYETFVTDCPLYLNKITIEESQVKMHSDNSIAPVASSVSGTALNFLELEGFSAFKTIITDFERLPPVTIGLLSFSSLFACSMNSLLSQSVEDDDKLNNGTIK